jgi:ferrous iron transport protein B
MGLIRRDFGAAGFFSMHLVGSQMLVAMVTITLFVPCMASALVVLKERGWRYLIGLFAGSLGSAFLLGGIVHQVIRLFGGV